MKNLVFVDCESDGPCPSMGRCTEIGAVLYPTKETFYGDLRLAGGEHRVFTEFDMWLTAHVKGRPIMVSDNPAFDFQWVVDGFWRTLGRCPFGHSARRISDFYAGLTGDFSNSQKWKAMRITPHDHNPVNDAMGNLEAFERMLAGER